jgi:hypothetical protein
LIESDKGQDLIRGFLLFDVSIGITQIGGIQVLGKKGEHTLHGLSPGGDPVVL